MMRRVILKITEGLENLSLDLINYLKGNLGFFFKCPFRSKYSASDPIRIFKIISD
jgi:hypothetical protein